MNRKLKNALRSAFEAPEPVDKKRFLESLRYPKTTRRDFFLSQLGYIRKRIWALSVLIVLTGWAAAFLSPLSANWHIEGEKIWIVSALLPFLALLTATEIYRSAFYRMAELEISCRFSLPQIIIARTAILGGGNFLVLAMLLTFISRVSPYGLLQTATYLLAPYLITCGVCLLILNKIRGGESIYGCAVATCFVSMTNVIFSMTMQVLYSNAFLTCWLLVFAAGALLVGLQIRRLLKQTEDRTWNNLLLTE